MRRWTPRSSLISRSPTRLTIVTSPKLIPQPSTNRLLRSRANRSRSARRAALPTIPSPGFSNESAHDDDRVREGDPEVDDLPSPLRAPHQLLVSVIPGVGSLHDPTFRGL